MNTRRKLSSFESLETRRLLSSSFASVNSNGTLSVVGTSKADTITVQTSGSKVQAILNGATESFTAASVKRIWVEAFAGNDKISNKTDLPSTLIGDDGNDTLSSGAGDDSLFGDNGNDVYQGGLGNNEFYQLNGNITIDYSTIPASTFDLQSGSMTRTRGNESQTDYLINSVPQDTTIILTPGNDIFIEHVEEGWEPKVYGGAGDDQFYAGECFVPFVDGGSGNDTFNFGYEGGMGTIVGGDGNDTINDDSGYQTAENWDLGGGTDTWNLHPDNALDGGTTYAQTLPSNLENFTLSELNAPVKITGNGLNNHIEVHSAGGATVNGESGNDYIEVDNVNNQFTQLTGVANLLGGSGNDTLVGSANADVFSGGSGTDTADYSSRTDNLNITLDNKANDGTPGENDNVEADVENVITGSGNDFIAGNPSNNSLEGGTGDDTIWGGSGNDTLIGDAGHDELHGQEGNDVLYGKDGQTDTLDGGDGTDKAQRDNSSSIKDQIMSIESFI